MYSYSAFCFLSDYYPIRDDAGASSSTRTWAISSRLTASATCSAQCTVQRSSGSAKSRKYMAVNPST